MNRRECLLGVGASSLAFGLGSILPVKAFAESAYPTRAVSISTGYAPGGITDVAARLLANALSEELEGASFIVENRQGASGTLAVDWLGRQEGDGYSLALTDTSAYAIWPSMREGGTRYDPMEDFSWIFGLCSSPLVFVVSQDFPADTVEEALRILASDQSEELNFSSGGIGSITHIAAELLTLQLGSGARSTHVPYAGGAPAVLSVAQNETSWGIPSLGSASSLLDSGMVRALAVTGASRFPLRPDIPTFAESGLPEMQIALNLLLHAPAGLPEAVLQKLSAASVAALDREDVKETLLSSGMQPWSGPNDPAAIRALVEQELERYAAVGEQAGVTITGG